MKKQILFHILIIFSFGSTLAQNVFITKPRLSFNGDNLIISYDIIADVSNEKYFIWVKLIDNHGKEIGTKSLSGDIGKNVDPGYNKKIIWIPEDSVYLKEKIFVQVKAERYVKSFDRNTMLMKSLVLPGWGQTKATNGEPWWTGSIAAYGFLAGGIIYHKKYENSYHLYSFEEDPLKRADFLNQSQKQLNVSTAMFFTSLSVWIANIIWVAAVPERYHPLQHAKLSLDPSQDGSPLFSLIIEF